MSRILIVYATHHGQTERIARALATRLGARGHAAVLADASAGVEHLPSPAGYDAVVLGSRVRFGRHAPVIGAYVHAHRDALLDVRTAFFSVSLSASDPHAGTDPNGYVRKLLEELAWTPGHTIAFAGALPYRQYGWFTRFVMKQFSRAAGHTTDTSRDHSFTDWLAVAGFADELALALRPPAAPPWRPIPARERARA